ncbi:hypothetical protein SDC9_167734 [bioreactor metagenome]|uniref:Uncharacterized protein n=1 Tax=bioreactor metagenome TaxID=1076179 RepID=A0A645G2G6_9ZZZZ
MKDSENEFHFYATILPGRDNNTKISKLQIEVEENAPIKIKLKKRYIFL